MQGRSPTLFDRSEDIDNIVFQADRKIRHRKKDDASDCYFEAYERLQAAIEIVRERLASEFGRLGREPVRKSHFPPSVSPDPRVIQPDLPRLEGPFRRLWGSERRLGKKAKARFKDPDDKLNWSNWRPRYRAKGPPGALVRHGYADQLLKKNAIKAGKLRKGAVIQVWEKRSDFRKVKTSAQREMQLEELGHTFVFLRYGEGGLIGADGGIWTGSRPRPTPFKYAKFEVMFGANVFEEGIFPPSA